MYDLTCLLCGLKGRDLWRDGRTLLMAMEKHAMDCHAVRPDDLGRCSRELSSFGYAWTLPDGRKWLKAVLTAP